MTIFNNYVEFKGKLELENILWDPISSYENREIHFFLRWFGFNIGIFIESSLMALVSFFFKNLGVAGGFFLQ